MLAEHNEYGFISESLALKGYNFTVQTNKTLLLPL